MTQRVYNFSAGPAVLPEPVLAEAQRDLMALPGVGSSVLEISHRSGAFRTMIEQAEANLRKLLAIPENYAVLFLQGGGRLQFSMIPMNLFTETRRSADTLLTGSWGTIAAKEGAKFGTMRVAWDGKETNYDRIPGSGDFKIDPQAAYVHTTSNETIQGVQFQEEPDTGEVPLVCDMSSDFLSRPIPVDRYGLIFACAQKNIGPAGVTVVILRKDLLDRSQESLPGYLNYKIHADAGSLWNTAPTFPIYIVKLVTQWILDEFGDLGTMQDHNQQKAKMLYDTIDGSNGFYEGHAVAENRSMMNVTFRLPDEALTKKFCEQGKERNLHSLAGHRNVGGIRASIYNAMPVAGCETLRDFMLEFHKEHTS